MAIAPNEPTGQNEPTGRSALNALIALIALIGRKEPSAPKEQSGRTVQIALKGPSGPKEQSGPNGASAANARPGLSPKAPWKASAMVPNRRSWRVNDRTVVAG
jgi:hypothetical protein